jgi:hypothetical protein
MKKPPDFSKIFFEYFGPTPRKVEYEVRSGVLGLHDLIFLSSLIHDARLKRSTVVYKNRRLIIPLERDCWEIPAVQQEGCKELYITNSRLIINAVEKIEWSFSHGFNFAIDNELWLNNIRCDFHRTYTDSNDKNISMCIDGIDWKCCLRVNEDKFKIKLQDIEIPFLYSKKHSVKAGQATKRKQ